MRTVTRRSFLKWGSALLGPLFVRGNLLLPQRIGAQSEEAYHQDNGTLHTTIGQSFLGEKLTYSAEFLWFKRAATIEISFEALSQDKQYLGTVKGQTRGFVGLATWFRRDILTCRMEETDGGTRLRPLECRDDVIIGSRQRKALTVFDYSAGQVMITREKDNKVRQKTIPIPQGETFYDPISGSYNFRFGSFGAIERGREYVIKTVPKKNFTSIRINIASPEEEKKRRSPSGTFDDNAYFITLQVNKDLIQSKAGIIEGWLSSKLVPTEGRVRDVIFFGDVIGKLTTI